MTLASEVEGTSLYAADGALAGSVSKLLFHPSGEAVVVGAAVRPPVALVVVERPETYIPLSALKFKGGHVWLLLDKLPKTKASAAKLGYDPDLTIIWSGMPVKGPSGAEAGIVSDFEFDPETGAVSELFAAGGAVADTAYGQLSVPIELVGGYSEGAVHVSAEAPELEATGGLAKAAAATVVGASGAVAAAGDAVVDVVVRAGGATGKAIKAVKDSQIAEKAARTVGSTWRESVKAFREGAKKDE